MAAENKKSEKSRLHIRNRNRERYDLKALKAAVPELEPYLTVNKYGDESVDFAHPEAVRLLNTALLKHYYGIQHWDFPADHLCPPIPGRADYLHYMADLLEQSNFGSLPHGDKITVLDVGVGASCIYPLLGVTEYGWNFIGSDTEEASIASAAAIATANEALTSRIDIRLQADPSHIFQGILREGEKIDLTFCNPPFHATEDEAEAGSRRKVQALTGRKVKTPALNFGGLANELIYPGGEAAFIQKMVAESRKFARQVYWFSTLVSKESNLKRIYKSLSALEASSIKTIPMGTGNKSSRIVAWSFLSKAEQKEWRETRWKA